MNEYGRYVGIKLDKRRYVLIYNNAVMVMIMAVDWPEERRKVAEIIHVRLLLNQALPSITSTIPPMTYRGCCEPPRTEL
jgi:hypothetical protein